MLLMLASVWLIDVNVILTISSNINIIFIHRCLLYVDINREGNTV